MPDSLADAADALTKGTGGTRHKVDLILEALEGVEREAVERVLRDRDRASARAVARLLTEHGHRVSPAAVSSWRDRERVPFHRGAV